MVLGPHDDILLYWDLMIFLTWQGILLQPTVLQELDNQQLLLSVEKSAAYWFDDWHVNTYSSFLFNVNLHGVSGKMYSNRARTYA